MASSPFLEALHNEVLVCDGAMGTQLMAAGLAFGACGELWNLEHPDRIRTIQKRYVDAGANCIITNSFGASRIRLHQHDDSLDVVAINKAAVEVARSAFGDKPGFVLGDIGPLGEMLEPYGELEEDDASEALEEQATALVEGGVDAVIIETQTALEEIGLAVAAARKAGAPCIIVSLAYDLSADKTFYKTMMGIGPEDAARFAVEVGADVIGLNCGTGMDMAGAAKVAAQYRSACALPIMVQPNAGQPVFENGVAVYRQPPAEMAAFVPAAIQAGARVIGSCCGSTPEHTRAIRATIGG